jgi:hypothetical protein
VITEANAMSQQVMEQLQRDGLRVQPFITTNASKGQAVEALAPAFELDFRTHPFRQSKVYPSIQGWAAGSWAR